MLTLQSISHLEQEHDVVIQSSYLARNRAYIQGLEIIENDEVPNVRQQHSPYKIFVVNTPEDRVFIGNYLNDHFKQHFAKNDYGFCGYHTMQKRENCYHYTVHVDNWEVPPIKFEEIGMSHENKLFFDIDYYNGRLTEFIELVSSLDNNVKSVYIYHQLPFRYDECVIFRGGVIFFVKRREVEGKKLAAHIIYHNTYEPKNKMIWNLRLLRHPILTPYLEDSSERIMYDTAVYKRLHKNQKFRLPFYDKDENTKNGIFEYAINYPYWYLSTLITVRPKKPEKIDSVYYTGEKPRRFQSDGWGR